MEDEGLLQEIFQIFDKDGNNTICQAEFADVVRAMGFNPNDDEVKRIFKSYDVDGSGKMDFEELKKMFSAFKSSSKGAKEDRDELEAAFKRFDRNGDGFISVKEIRSLLQMLGEKVTDEDVKEMLESCDSDGDDRISISEFADHLYKPLKGKK